MSETIPSALHDQRIDRVVALIADVSRSATASLIKAGGVTLDGEVVTAGKIKVRQGQSIGVDTALLPTKELPSADPSINISVVFADDDVIVVNKAPGVVVHPGAGNPTRTLINGALSMFPEIATVGDPLRPGVVHRLDAGTSGLMLLARSQTAYDALVKALSERRVSRKYEALVWGHPDVAVGVIDAPIGRDHRDPTKMSVVVDGRFARTRYEVRRTFAKPMATALVECELDTGRTHQIRVHLASIGHPIVGDPTYGGARSSLSSPRPLLHAAKLGFVHPVSGVEMKFDATQPEDMSDIISRCE
ncbi:MAG: RluA family pseudouridine synthase [Ilumatobacteraceae bacterium]